MFPHARSWFDPELAWAAGFFEGEGTITTSGSRLVVRVTNTDSEPLQQFAEIIGWGAVYGPYERSARDGFARKPLWIWLAENENALEVLELLWPWLSGRRRSRALELAPLEAIHLRHANDRAPS